MPLFSLKNHAERKKFLKLVMQSLCSIVQCSAAKERLIARIQNELEIDDSEPALVERRSSSTSEHSTEPSTEPAKKSSIMEQITKKIWLDKEQRLT